MSGEDYTNMGGTGEAFLTTNWSLIGQAGSGDEDSSRTLIGLLMNRYWRPIYCYLRRKGYGNEQSKDLTQGFFHEVVLGHHLIEKADPAKGRFRSFLLIALNRYLINVRNEETAQKRIPKEKLVPLDMVEPAALPQTVAQSAAEDCFDYAWVSTLLERVLEEVESKCHEDGKTVYWYVFRDRVLQPILDRTNPPTLKEICAKYGIEDDTKASNMIVTVKRRFQVSLRRHVRGSLTSDDQVNGELEEIKRFFPRMAQESE
jgi:RNA polymerase sigma-70 factor (ECF subfamily)